MLSAGLTKPLEYLVWKGDTPRVGEKNGEQVGPEIEKKNIAELLWCGAHPSCYI